jgi:hypothetical protein
MKMRGPNKTVDILIAPLPDEKAAPILKSPNPQIKEASMTVKASFLRPPTFAII